MRRIVTYAELVTVTAPSKIVGLPNKTDEHPSCKSCRRFAVLLWAYTETSKATHTLKGEACKNTLARNDRGETALCCHLNEAMQRTALIVICCCKMPAQASSSRSGSGLGRFHATSVDVLRSSAQYKQADCLQLPAFLFYVSAKLPGVTIPRSKLYNFHGMRACNL